MESTLLCPSRMFRLHCSSTRSCLSSPSQPLTIVCGSRFILGFKTAHRFFSRLSPVRNVQGLNTDDIDATVVESSAVGHGRFCVFATFLMRLKTRRISLDCTTFGQSISPWIWHVHPNPSSSVTIPRWSLLVLTLGSGQNLIYCGFWRDNLTGAAELKVARSCTLTTGQKGGSASHLHRSDYEAAAPGLICPVVNYLPDRLIQHLNHSASLTQVKETSAAWQT
ncbi:hypothetical protein RRG08_020009 [Elysia crispata]|uniref:Uncharacterized protein n=1 Tax=Elysia crispata TaxID=231223 RepID=A0AAE1BB70_9GAST|nr:hypothetical protein RRG08_020009 [Elysia crispata]